VYNKFVLLFLVLVIYLYKYISTLSNVYASILRVCPEKLCACVRPGLFLYCFLPKNDASRFFFFFVSTEGVAVLLVVFLW